ncbi:MAG: porin [Rhodobacteraceae bacterium]|nr:porin [Paracoccaceae bacterium]
MQQNRRHTAGLALAALLGSTGLAWADSSTQDELDALRARVDALEAQKAANSGPGDFRIGGTTLDFYGYIKSDFFYDFDFVQGDTAFVNAIGEPGNATDGQFGATVRQSRFGLRTSTQTDIGELKAQLELDLFASGGRADLRLRHANIQIGDNWTIGQTWTNFMPLSHYPTSVEFNGPVGITFARVPQIRYTGNAGNGLQYSFSLEESNTTSSDPVITGAVSYTGDRFSARAAVLGGNVTVGGVEVDQTGFTASGGLTPWQGGLIQATFTTGEALGPLFIGGGSAIVGGQANDVDGYTLEFRQDVGSDWNFGIGYGREEYDLPSSTGTLNFTELETLHVNAFYSPTDNLTFGAEYIFGERTSSTGATVNGDRVQFSAQLNF